MKECLDPKSRKKLENKLLALLGETMQPLSKEFQILLADDLVTAFESRFKVLTRAQTPMECCVETASEIEPQLI
ncbi:MAG: hypothetical protein ABSD42_08265 [Candidatus Bathyarchaeia archaeon]|jgi:hypothetical protein